jgi:proprotein convertase subtilisin/kexin type 5
MSCDAACLTCTGPNNSTCTSCTGGLLLVQNLTGGYCIGACLAVGYTQSGTSCLECHTSCLTCSGTANNECLSCPSGTYLSNSYCRMVCPPASFPNTTSSQCSPCDGSCTYCFGSTIDNCTGCVSGMVLFNFTCTLSCPAGYTVNQWSVCHEHTLTLGLALAFLAFLLL